MTASIFCYLFEHVFFDGIYQNSEDAKHWAGKALL